MLSIEMFIPESQCVYFISKMVPAKNIFQYQNEKTPRKLQVVA
jgi:hypothetical protein